MTVKSKAAISASELTASTENPFPAVFHAKMGVSHFSALSDAFGLSQFGVNMEVVEPGGSSGLKHWHSHSEEFVYVLSGKLLLDYGEQKQELSAGMCIGFKAGEGKGHRLLNQTDEVACFIVIGSRVTHDKATYDEDDMQWLVGDDGQWRAARKDGTLYEE